MQNSIFSLNRRPTRNTHPRIAARWLPLLLVVSLAPAVAAAKPGNGLPFQQQQAEIDAVAVQGNQSDARLDALEALVAQLTTQVAALQGAQLTCATQVGDDVIFEGCNVHVRDGSGDTDGATNGRGNLVVGYNEDFGLGTGRNGSHNLVVGPGHSYASYGGLVAGEENSVLAPGASVCGGRSNTASGDNSTVTGGFLNVAGGQEASVSGGIDNRASGTSRRSAAAPRTSPRARTRPSAAAQRTRRRATPPRSAGASTGWRPPSGPR